MGTRKYPPLPPSTRPIHKVPRIVSEILESDGTRYYLSEDERLWNADIFDFNFKTTKLRVLPKFRADGTYEKDDQI
jgi:hypothetical protein